MPQLAVVMVVFALLLPTATVAQKPPDNLVSKDLRRLKAVAKKKDAARPRISFCWTEAEFNTFVAEAMRETPRPGFEKATTWFLAGNRVKADAMLDFDAVERWRPGTVPMLLRPILRGKKVIGLDASFSVTDGMLTYTIQQGRFENIPIPGVVVQRAIEAIGRRQKEALDLAKPIALGYGLQQLRTEHERLCGANFRATP